MTALEAAGQVVECYGRRVVVRTDESGPLNAEIFGKRMSVVCGDRVRVRQGATGDIARVIEVLPRTSLLARTDSRGRAEDLAANVDLLLVLVSPEPESDPYIVDRYLAGAAYASLTGVVIVNKSDLQPSPYLARSIEEYRAAGYSILRTSAHTGDGIAELGNVIGQRVAMLVGQSGVGKSTLTNALVPASTQRTRALSDSTGEGRHTTVSSIMFSLPPGGALIDSPGVRDYAPIPLADSTVQVGWPEILTAAPQCRFNDCLHLREPGCAVLAGIEAGTIAVRRYESYKRLLNLMRQLSPSYRRN